MEKKIESGSQIFYPYKSIGYVSSGVPFQLRPENLHYSIMLAIGNSFQLLNSIKLFPRLISNTQEGKIRDLSFYKKEFYLTTNKKEINLWNGPNLEFKFQGHSSTVLKILVFDNILLSLTKNNEFFMWDINSRLMFTEQLPQFPAESHRITTFIHPTGYFNKILIGFQSGELQLWNIKTKKLIYKFFENIDKGEHGSITTIQQSPVLDVVAIGFTDGTVIIQNLKQDKTIIKYQQRGRCNSITFRTDGLRQHIATSGPNGDILIWDLEKNKQFHHMTLAHGQECTKVEFLREEPILLSTGLDNSIKMWNFNGVDGVPVLLRERSGHLDPPKSVEFFGDDDNSIISLSDQSIRYISLAASTINHEMSKKKFKKDMKPFKGFSSNFRRNRSWETAISIHNDSKVAFTWDCNELSVKKQLNIKSSISSTTISSCGNFVFFGTVYGNIYKFNIQSGIKRAKALSPQKTSITSILVEPTNQYIIASGLDSIINYYDFKDLKLLYSINLMDLDNNKNNNNENNSNNKEEEEEEDNDEEMEENENSDDEEIKENEKKINPWKLNKNKKIRILKMNLHKDSGIFLTVSDDRFVRLFDIETRNMVRKFEVSSKINDAIFNHDGRWIIVSTNHDSIIRIFDIPSGKMIDWFKMPKPVTSISFSPKGEYLITTHSGQLPIYLWSNQFHFGSVFLKEPSSQPKVINLPSQVVELSNKINSKSNKGNDQDQEDDEKYEINEDLGVPEYDDSDEQDDSDNDSDNDEENQKSKIKQIENLITLSNDIPRSKWQTLLNLDIIKERNKPIQQKAKPELAPFFLSTIEGLEPKFVKTDIVNPIKPTPTEIKENGESADNNQEEEEQLEGWDNWAGGENDDDELVDEDGNPIDPEDVMDDEEIKEFEKTKKYKTEKEIHKSDKVIRTDTLQGTRTKFNLSLEQGYRTQDYSNSLSILKSMAPSGIDFEIRTLTSTENYADIHYMFDFICYQLLSNSDYDFIQSILSVTLKVHGHLLYTIDFKRDLRQLLLAFNGPWSKMQELFHSNICMLRYFTNTLNN